MKRFAIIGIGGYVAPRHMQAIKETGNDLVAGIDPGDSVGIIDQYFPQASFFTEFERFDRFLYKCRSEDRGIDYLVVCSPNYLHDAHVRYGLRLGTDVICEKPLVLNPWNLEALNKIQEETNKSINTILQLRLHPDILELKKKIDSSPTDKTFDVNLTYIAPRGKWYYASWKGDLAKSGGIATNIGIHFFDMLIWLFGDVVRVELHQRSHDRSAGFIELSRARVKWFLSINADHLPKSSTERRTFRSVEINGEALEFSHGFEKLHTRSYEAILGNKGFGIDDVRPSIELVHKLRKMTVTTDNKHQHPYCKFDITPHPFKSNHS